MTNLGFLSIILTCKFFGHMGRNGEFKKEGGDDVEEADVQGEKEANEGSEFWKPIPMPVSFYLGESDGVVDSLRDPKLTYVESHNFDEVIDDVLQGLREDIVNNSEDWYEAVGLNPREDFKDYNGDVIQFPTDTGAFALARLVDDRFERIMKTVLGTAIETRNMMKFEDGTEPFRKDAATAYIYRAFLTYYFHYNRKRKNGRDYMEDHLTLGQPMEGDDFEVVGTTMLAMKVSGQCGLMTLLGHTTHDDIEDIDGVTENNVLYINLWRDRLEKYDAKEIMNLHARLVTTVMAVTKASKDVDLEELGKEFDTKFHSHSEATFFNLMLGLKDEVKAILTKINDRIHNLFTIGGHDDLAKRQQKFDETSDVYLPIARILQICEAVKLMVDILMKHENPKLYERYHGLSAKKMAGLDEPAPVFEKGWKDRRESLKRLKKFFITKLELPKDPPKRRSDDWKIARDKILSVEKKHFIEWGIRGAYINNRWFNSYEEVMIALFDKAYGIRKKIESREDEQDITYRSCITSDLEGCGKKVMDVRFVPDGIEMHTQNFDEGFEKLDFDDFKLNLSMNPMHEVVVVVADSESVADVVRGAKSVLDFVEIEELSYLKAEEYSNAGVITPDGTEFAVARAVGGSRSQELMEEEDDESRLEFFTFVPRGVVITGFSNKYKKQMVVRVNDERSENRLKRGLEHDSRKSDATEGLRRVAQYLVDLKVKYPDIDILKYAKETLLRPRSVFKTPHGDLRVILKDATCAEAAFYVHSDYGIGLRDVFMSRGLVDPTCKKVCNVLDPVAFVPVGGRKKAPVLTFDSGVVSPPEDPKKGWSVLDEVTACPGWRRFFKSPQARKWLDDFFENPYKNLGIKGSSLGNSWAIRDFGRDYLEKLYGVFGVLSEDMGKYGEDPASYWMAVALGEEDPFEEIVDNFEFDENFVVRVSISEENDNERYVFDNFEAIGFKGKTEKRGAGYDLYSFSLVSSDGEIFGPVERRAKYEEACEMVLRLSYAEDLTIEISSGVKIAEESKDA